MNRIRVWFQAARVRLIFIPILSAALGSVLAYRDGSFSWEVFWPILLVVTAFHIGAHLAGEYFDYLAGVNQPASAVGAPEGGRFIQKGLLSPDDVFIVAMVAYATAIMLGLYLTFRNGWSLLVFGAAGFILSFFHSAPPLKLNSRGWGEPASGLLLGPVCVIGTYYAYALTFSKSALIFSLPIGFMAMAVVHLLGIITAEEDRAAGKLHWAARLGHERSAGPYYVLIAMAYPAILFPILFKMAPLWTIVSLISLPLALKACRTLRRACLPDRRASDKSGSLKTALEMTLKTYFSIGLLLIFGLLLDFWWLS